jgi:hypothetical protein
VHLAGGSVPSIDVIYDDLRRFDAHALEDLEEVVADHGVAPLRSWISLHPDVSRPDGVTEDRSRRA